MVGWHHQLNGHGFEKTLGSREGHGSLMFCSPWGHEESDMTDQLNNNSFYLTLDLCALLRFMPTTKSSGKFPQQKTLHLLPCMTPCWLSPHGGPLSIPLIWILFCHFYLNSPSGKCVRKGRNIFFITFTLSSQPFPVLFMCQLVLQRTKRAQAL